MSDTPKIKAGKREWLTEKELMVEIKSSQEFIDKGYASPHLVAECANALLDEKYGDLLNRERPDR